jgi:hypothetical protein
MKKLIIPALCLGLFASCKESGPSIFTGPKAVDTSYMTDVAEAPQQRVVVIEEFTGVSCPPCFLAHKKLKGLSDTYGDRLAIVGIQPVGPPQSKPLVANSHHPDVFTRHDNRTSDGTEIGTQIYGGIGSIPWAGIDRTRDGASALLIDSREWDTRVATRMSIAPEANVTITSTFNSTSNQAIIKVRVAYTKAVSKAQLLNVAFVEDNVIDAQEGGDTTDFEQNYTHRHVFRDMLTPATGSPILGNMPTKQPKLVYERTFVYDVDPAWNADNCHIVAYVTNNEGADVEVVQGAHTHLK